MALHIGNALVSLTTFTLKRLRMTLSNVTRRTQVLEMHASARYHQRQGLFICLVYKAGIAKSWSELDRSERFNV